MRSAPFALAALLALTAAHADEQIERRLAADPAGEVSVLNVSGEVTVTGWERNEVEVTGTLGKGIDHLEFTSEGKRTVVRVVPPDGGGHSGSSRLTIHVPQGSSLSTNTVSADQTVTNVRGVQRLQAVSGDVRTEAWSEEVEIKTVSGDVRLEGHGKPSLVTLTTVSGDATATDVAGEVAANTVTGDLEFEVRPLNRGRIRTTNGDLNLEADLAPDGRLDIETINGDMTIDFASGVSAQFDIETFNGDIDNCFGPEPVRTSKYAPGRELRFREGDADARVRIKSLNGGITFCR